MTAPVLSARMAAVLRAVGRGSNPWIVPLFSDRSGSVVDAGLAEVYAYDKRLSSGVIYAYLRPTAAGRAWLDAEAGEGDDA